MASVAVHWILIRLLLETPLAAIFWHISSAHRMKCTEATSGPCFIVKPREGRSLDILLKVKLPEKEVLTLR